MEFKDIYGISPTANDIKYYIEECIHNIYISLCVYEDCQGKDNYETYYIYLHRIISEFSGVYSILGFNEFFSIVAILRDMSNLEDKDHKIIKSLTFHCISILKKVVV